MSNCDGFNLKIMKCVTLLLLVSETSTKINESGEET